MPSRSRANTSTFRWLSQTAIANIPLNRIKSLRFPVFERSEDHRGVGVPTEAMTLILQLLTELPEIVDLAVEGQYESARGRPIGLVSFFREIEDRESAEPECDAVLRWRSKTPPDPDPCAPGFGSSAPVPLTLPRPRCSQT